MIKSLSRTIVYGIIFVAFIIIFSSLYKTCGAVVSSIFVFDDLVSYMPNNNITPVLLNMLVIHFMPVLTVLWLRRGSNFFACIGTIIWVAVLFMLETTASIDLATGIPSPIFGEMEEVKNYRLLFISVVCFVSTLASAGNGMFRSLSNISEKFGANFGKIILSFLASILMALIVFVIATLGVYIVVVSKYLAIALFVISAIILLVGIIKSFKKQPAVASNDGNKLNNNVNDRNGGFDNHFGNNGSNSNNNNHGGINFGDNFTGNNNNNNNLNNNFGNNGSSSDGFGGMSSHHNDNSGINFGDNFAGNNNNNNNLNNNFGNNGSNSDGFGGMSSHHNDNSGINFGDNFNGKKDSDVSNNNSFGGSKEEFSKNDEDDRPKF